MSYKKTILEAYNEDLKVMHENKTEEVQIQEEWKPKKPVYRDQHRSVVDAFTSLCESDADRQKRIENALLSESEEEMDDMEESEDGEEMEEGFPSVGDDAHIDGTDLHKTMVEEDDEEELDEDIQRDPEILDKDNDGHIEEDIQRDPEDLDAEIDKDMAVEDIQRDPEVLDKDNDGHVDESMDAVGDEDDDIDNDGDSDESDEYLKKRRDAIDKSMDESEDSDDSEEEEMEESYTDFVRKHIKERNFANMTESEINKFFDDVELLWINR